MLVESGRSFLLQLMTEDSIASVDKSFQAQDGLQQSQYLVVVPVPEVPCVLAVDNKAARAIRRLGFEAIMVTRKLISAR